MSYFRRPFFAWVAGGVLVLSLGACAGRAPSPPLVAPGPVLTPEAVLATIHAREANITSLKGLFQADVQGPLSSFSYRIQGTLFYQRPQSIRIKGFTRFGGTIFDFLLHGRSYALRMPQRRNPVVGQVPDFRRLGDLSVPVQLSLRAIDLLLGKIRWTADQFREVGVAKTAYRYTVSLSPVNARNDSVLQHVWVDRRSARIQAIEYRTSEGEKLITLTASDFRNVREGSHDQAGSMGFPFLVEVKDHTTSGSVTLEFSELVANVPVSGNEFAVR